MIATDADPVFIELVELGYATSPADAGEDKSLFKITNYGNQKASQLL